MENYDIMRISIFLTLLKIPGTVQSSAGKTMIF